MGQRVIICAFCLLVIGGCLDQPDCYQLNNNIVGIKFKKLFDNKADTLAIWDIRTAGTDSIFYARNFATGVYLPLDFLGDGNNFIFRTYNNSFIFSPLNQSPQTGVLDLAFSSTKQFVSLDCGVRYILENLKVNNHDFDSVRILSNVPGNSNSSTNIEIYRCPQPNILKIKFRQVVAGKTVADTVSLEAITSDYSWNISFASDSLVTQVKIPLNDGADITTYNFEFTGKSNLLKLGYTRTENLLFDVCGNQQFISDLDTIMHDFDSIRITKDTIQDPPVTNLEIFH